MVFNFHRGKKNRVNFANGTWFWDPEIWTRWPLEGVCISTILILRLSFQFSCRKYLYPFWKMEEGWFFRRSVNSMPGVLQITVLPTLFSCFSNAALLHFGFSERMIFFLPMNCQHKLVGASPTCQLQEVLLAQSLLKTSMSFLFL